MFLMKQIILFRRVDCEKITQESFSNQFIEEI